MSYYGGSAFADAAEPRVVAETELHHGNRLYARFLKRPFDLALALLALPVCLPAIALLWALVRLEGGPGFFSQARVGRGGRRDGNSDRDQSKGSDPGDAGGWWRLHGAPDRCARRQQRVKY